MVLRNKYLNMKDTYEYMSMIKMIISNVSFFMLFYRNIQSMIKVALTKDNAK